MMIDLCNKLVDNELTREELLERVVIEKTNENDINDICKTIAKAFDLSCPDEVLFQLIHSNVAIDESIKLVDKYTNEIYGLLMLCEYNITKGSPILMLERGLGEYLDRFSQINGHSFVIDERLRNCGLDKKMLFHNIDFLKENYDLIWIGVEESLKSHNYWKRLGFTEVFEIKEAVFYMFPLNEKIIAEYL